ncbi:MAG: carbohydrate ABC transporter permease [Candidatus Aenigmatarchaeota archaeon]
MKIMLFKHVIIYTILFFFSIIFILPFWTCFTTSLKSEEDVIYTIPIQFPLSPTIKPFEEALNIMQKPLLNSFIFTTFATIFSSILGSMNGYIFSKIKFKKSESFFIIFTIGIFIPYQIVLVPLVVTMSKIGLYNNIWGLVLTHTAYGIPICTLFFRNFYEEIPESLIAAAKIDGAGTWMIYRKIVLPLSAPAFVITGVFQFTSIWNDFLFGLVLARGTEALPASVALANLKGTTTAFWNVQMAGAWLYALPVIVIYILLGKYLMRGYMAGAIKG